MKKKTIIICLVTFIVALIIAGVIFWVTKNNKEHFDNTIVSILTMDINPSIEINLNKDNLVVSVKPLNEDSKKILKNKDFKMDKVEDTISTIIESLKENDYLNEDSNLILINVESNDENLKELIQNETTSVLEEKQVTAEIIIQQVERTDELEELAKKNNITVSKAYYIQEQIKNEEGLTVEDFKDVSIDEVKTKIDSYKEEQNKSNQEEQNNNSQTSSNNGPSNYTKPVVSCNPPGAATENLKDWCTFNTSRPQSCEFNYPEMLEYSQVNQLAFNHLGISSWDSIGTYASQKQDSRSSYCISKFVIITTKERRVTITFDSVTGAIIDETSESVPSPSISEEDAIKVLLDHYGLSREDCKMCSARFSTNGEGSPNWYYRYDTSILMNNDEYHLANINPFNGSIIQIIR